MSAITKGCYGIVFHMSFKESGICHGRQQKFEFYTDGPNGLLAKGGLIGFHILSPKGGALGGNKWWTFLRRAQLTRSEEGSGPQTLFLGATWGNIVGRAHTGWETPVWY